MADMTIIPMTPEEMAERFAEKFPDGGDRKPEYSPEERMRSLCESYGMKSFIKFMENFDAAEPIAEPAYSPEDVRTIALMANALDCARGVETDHEDNPTSVPQAKRTFDETVKQTRDSSNPT